MSKDRMNKEIDDAIELFESAHYVIPSYDAEMGSTRYSNSEVPSFRSIRKLKRTHSDYRPGIVKVYTAEEIEEYVKSKTIHRTDGRDQSGSNNQS